MTQESQLANKLGPILWIFVLLLSWSPPCAKAQDSPVIVSNSSFNLQFHNGGIVSLKHTGDAFDTDYILEGQRFGDVVIRYRQGSGDWTELSTKELSANGELQSTWNAASNTYTAQGGDELQVTVTYTLEDQGMNWDIGLENRTGQPLEVGDVALPMPMNHDWSWDREVTYNQRVIRHSMISGHNSFLYWMRSNAVGPYLMMTPTGDTHLEYVDETENENGRDIYTPYIHSKAQELVIAENNGSWRLPHTSTTLEAREEWQRGFHLEWAMGHEDVRTKLHQNGLFNIEVAPGMTIPRDLPVKVALKNQAEIDQITAEFPEATAINFVETNSKGYRIYEINFEKLGENRLDVTYGDDKQLYLEFFVTEPIETLIKKRGNFIAERQQIKDDSKWYDGLLSDWSMKDELLLSPDNYHDIPRGRRYMVSSDDPALSRPSFLAKKNVIYPDQQEVKALDYYIANFVWGGLQMTTDEAYPYAIYGIHEWINNRQSEDDGQYGKLHIWRIYDYPHIIQMYVSMYRVARYHPHIETELAAEQYLERAYGTAAAFFTVPEEVIGWSPYETGNYNELSIVDLIEELEKAGWGVKATRLRHNWEKKVDYFVSGEANLFGSEYPYDTTGFESTHAFARYAIAVADRPEEDHDALPVEVTGTEAQNFMQQQILVNVGSRGWLEKAYYMYGSDYRGSGNAGYLLSYMAQMGGWSLLDYSLQYADNPHEYLKLGYGSILSSWALMNTGTEESNYGYWYPGEVNDGGAGGGFEPLAYGQTWLQQPHGRGSWYYGCEIDLGFTGYLRAATTVLAEDPVFGLTAFGGLLNQQKSTVEVIPKDGVRRRFSMLFNGHRADIWLDYDRFAADEPIVVNRGLDRIAFTLENAGTESHQAELTFETEGGQDWQLTLDGSTITPEKRDGKQVFTLDITGSQHNVVLTRAM